MRGLFHTIGKAFVKWIKGKYFVSVLRAYRNGRKILIEVDKIDEMGRVGFPWHD